MLGAKRNAIRTVRMALFSKAASCCAICMLHGGSLRWRPVQGSLGSIDTIYPDTMTHAAVAHLGRVGVVLVKLEDTLAQVLQLQQVTIVLVVKLEALAGLAGRQIASRKF